jgi:hypothetical protein
LLDILAVDGIFQNFCFLRKMPVMGNTKESTKRKVADRVLEILRRPDVATTGIIEKAVAMLHDSACFEEELSRFYRYVQELPGAKAESEGDG